MNFENIPIPQEKKDEPDDVKKPRSKAGAVGAALLVGALAQPPEILAQDDMPDESFETPVATKTADQETDAKRRMISFSEYQSGRRLATDRGDTQEAYERAIVEAKSRKPDFLTEKEREVKQKAGLAKEAVRTDELLEITREKLRTALDSVIGATGQNPGQAIRMAGNLVIESALGQLDTRLTDSFEKSVIGTLSPEDRETAKFLRDPRYTGNMMFTRALGDGKSWKLEAGADPGLTIGGKLDPRVGITFRMKLPD